MSEPANVQLRTGLVRTPRLSVRALMAQASRAERAIAAGGAGSEHGSLE